MHWATLPLSGCYDAPAGTPQPKWTVPRSTAALPISAADGRMLSGVSAFAFQGTNAHALLARPEGGSLPDTSRLAAVGWQREACWVAPPVHIMLHSARSTGVGSARKAGLQMECHLSATPRLASFWDHRVAGRVLFPGAGFFELATAAVKMAAGKTAATVSAALAGISIPAPLQLPEQQQALKAAPVVLRVNIRLASGAVAVASSPAAFKQQHLSASTATVTVTAADAAAAAATDSGSALPVGQRVRLLLLAAPQMAAIQPASHASINNSACDSTSHFHPASLDSCLQLAAATGDSALKVPASLACLHTADRMTAPQLAAASRQQGGPTAADTASVVDYWLVEAGGSFGMSVSSLELKPLGKLPTAVAAAVPAAAAAAEELLYEVGWPAAQPVALAAATTHAAAVSSVQLLPALCGIAAAAGAIAALQASQLKGLGGVQLSTSGVLLAPAAAAAGAGSRSAGHAAEGGLTGLMRTLALEYQAQRFGSVDADSLAPAAAGGAPAGARLAMIPPGATPEADAYGSAQRGGVQQCSNLLPAKARSSIPAFHLMPRPRGALSSLKPEPVATASVAPGHVLMAVKAVGVNFRCVMRGVHMLTPALVEPSWPAISCRLLVMHCLQGPSQRAGHVPRRPRGARSRQLWRCPGCWRGRDPPAAWRCCVWPGSGQPGQPRARSRGHRCVGWSLRCSWQASGYVVLRSIPFEAHTQLPIYSCAPAVVPMPTNLGFEEAASTPTVFITVDCAFRQSAAVQPGDRVLVHAAAGGVGLAALQMVAAQGGTAVATAGSPNKRALVRSLGAQQVLDSRDTDFATQLAEVGGVSVVLNSLTSSGMVAGSLAALGAGGRFVEISKRDIWSAARIAQGKPYLLLPLLRAALYSPSLHGAHCFLNTQQSFATFGCLQSALMWPTRWWRLTSCLLLASMPHSRASAASWRQAC